VTVVSLEYDHPDPVGIIVGTFEPDSDFCYNRNVVGRLLAVALGASTVQVKDGTEMSRLYAKVCKQVACTTTLAGSMVHPSRITWCIVVNGKVSGENRETPRTQG
jgi:hypothetical protein